MRNLFGKGSGSAVVLPQGARSDLRVCDCPIANKAIKIRAFDPYTLSHVRLSVSKFEASRRLVAVLKGASPGGHKQEEKGGCQ